MRRRLLFASLYMSEGAPIGYIWWYLPTRLRLEGVAVGEIGGLLAVLVLPWTLKFLWAPLVDLSARRGVPIRAWIVGAQAVMALTLVPLIGLEGADSIAFLRLVLLCHAVAAATQDVAIDTFAIRATPAGELGSINGWMQAGMLLGRSLFGGVALFLRPRIGDDPVVFGLIGIILLNLVAALRAREPFVPEAPPARTERTAGAGASFGRTLAEAARRPGTWWGLCFAGVAGAAYEGIGAVAGPFLVDRGLGEATIGAFLAGPTVAAMLLGSLLGGAASDRIGRVRAAGWSLGAIGALGAGLSVAAGGASPAVLLAGLTGLYFGIGCFTSSSYALFMGLTDPRLGATQFSAFMAATNGCESWAALATGRLAQAQGYGPAFAWMVAASLASIPLLRPLGRALKGAAASRDRSEDRAAVHPPDAPRAG